MNKKIEKAQTWINDRDKREKIILFLLSLFVIYQLWNLILIKPIHKSHEHLQNDISMLESQRNAIDQQYTTILKIVKSSEFVNLSNQQQILRTQRKNVREKIAKFTPVFVNKVDYTEITKNILQQLNPSIVLISLKEFPDEPWDAPEIDKSVILVKNIFEHKLLLAFRANYMDTIAFLQRIEQLPWYFYWDHLEYKVTDYPEAEVIVQLYVLSYR